ncbi:hypothetical protein T484DRAFT_1808968 [Baffinella frigidus]|nr:hypothetical protein T484DRAFT_1808968 [Cryptophyta sp. CCMP2293]
MKAFNPRMKAVEAGEAAAPVTQGGGEPSLPVAAPAAYAPRSHGASEREQEARPRPGKNLASPGLSLWRDPRNAQVTVVGFAVAPTKDVREGDLLKEVDGSKVKGRSLDDIQRMLTGKKDSRVEVTLKRGFFSVKLSLRRAVAVPE